MTGPALGRAVQGRIYRRGALGYRPGVPVLPRRLEKAAQARMSRRAWAYVAGSAGQQRTARANLEAFARHRLVPRMLRDVADRDTADGLRGTLFLIDAAELPPIEDPDEYYDHQLEGLRVVTTAGTTVGTVAEVLHTPAGELLAVCAEGGDGEQLEDKGLGHAPTPLPHIIPPDIIPLIMTVFLPPAFSWRTSPSVAPEPCSLRPSDGGGS